MFVQDDDLVDIVIYWRQVGYNYEAHTNSEFKKLKAAGEKEIKSEEDRLNFENKMSKFKILNVKMKILTWGLYNDLQENAMVVSAVTGDRHFNLKMYKEQRLKRLLTNWDALNKEGKPVSISDGSIAHLAPDIAETILRGYDEMSFLDEEQEKNF